MSTTPSRPQQRRTVSTNSSEANKQPAQDEPPSSGGLWGSAVRWWTSQRTQAGQCVHATSVSTVAATCSVPTLVVTPH